MKKENVKKFIKQHKWDIVNVLFHGALVGVTFYSGYRYRGKTNTIVKDDTVTAHIISDAVATYNNYCSEFGTGIHGCKGYVPAELGKLGEHMLKMGVGDKDTFTHFIAMGQPRE